MERAEIENQVKRIIADKMGHSDPITDETTLRNDIGMDSLDQVEFLMALEDEYEIEIGDDDVASDKVNTFKDVIDYLVMRNVQSPA